MSRRGVALLAIVAGICAWGAQPAAAEKLQFQVTSSYGEGLQIHFYSETRQVSWPGPGRSYDLSGSGTQTISIGCDPGEHICYGAWVKQNPKVSWGVGLNKARACRGCCYYCDGGTVRISLTP